MHKLRRWTAVLLMLVLPGTVLRAADANLPALMIEQITTDDPRAMIEALKQINAGMNSAAGVPQFLRLYQTQSLGNLETSGFLLSPAGDFTALLENNRRFIVDPKLARARSELDATTHLGAPVFLKAVRFDGTNTPGWLNNYLIRTDNEDRLLQSVANLHNIAQGSGGQVLVNVFRVVAGETDYTHLVSFNVANREALGSLMNVMVDHRPRSPDFTVIANQLFAEILLQ